MRELLQILLAPGLQAQLLQEVTSRKVEVPPGNGQAAAIKLKRKNDHPLATSLINNANEIYHTYFMNPAIQPS